ncbi:hypothetical protein AN958_01281, partial [Leucoagaricus sp. SymC.cos]
RSDAEVQFLKGDQSISDDEHPRTTLVRLDIKSKSTNVPSERDHASQHAGFSSKHLNFNVLQSLPGPPRHFDGTHYYMSIKMPDLMKPVFMHALKDCPPVVLPDGIPHETLKGHISLTHSSIVEHLISRGEVELI